MVLALHAEFPRPEVPRQHPCRRVEGLTNRSRCRFASKGPYFLFFLGSLLRYSTPYPKSLKSCFRPELTRLAALLPTMASAGMPIVFLKSARNAGSSVTDLKAFLKMATRSEDTPGGNPTAL